MYRWVRLIEWIISEGVIIKHGITISNTFRRCIHVLKISKIGAEFFLGIYNEYIKKRIVMIAMRNSLLQNDAKCSFLKKKKLQTDYYLIDRYINYWLIIIIINNLHITCVEIVVPQLSCILWR